MNSGKPANTTATVLGQPMTIVFESGRTAMMTMRPFKVREFNELLPLLGQEPALIEKALGVIRGSLVETEDPVHPDCYDILAEQFRSLNRPFFAYCTRQTTLMNQVQGKTLERALTLALEQRLSSLGDGSFGSRPTPAGA